MVITEIARQFARNAHAGQKYGDGDYYGHLSEVVHILKEFGASEDQIATGWLHDVLEDTKVPVSLLRNTFGNHITDLVDACTGVGTNRQTRNSCIYNKLRHNREACLVKIADRIANVTSSMTHNNEKLVDMYKKENDAFLEVVRHSGYDRAIETLESLFAKRKV